jgi:hypothetical protein
MPFRAVLVAAFALFAFLGVSLLSARSAHAASNTDAPLCDERAASAYAEEPAPQPVDDGELNLATDACKTVLVNGAPVSSNDDLQKSPPVAHDSQLLVPAAAMLIPAAVDTDGVRAIVADRPSDEHRRNDNPPPRPIPWRG